jgi:hypothetical protein
LLNFEYTVPGAATANTKLSAVCIICTNPYDKYNLLVS